MKLISMIPVLALVGCTTTEPLVVTETVKVPVVVQCVDVEDVPPVPKRATEALSSADNLDTKVRAILNDLKIYEANDRVFRALLSGCL